MGWMPGVDRSQTWSGNRHKAKIDKVVLHTTEGAGWPDYNGGRNAPHFTLRHTGMIRQHMNTADHAAKALVNKPSGVQTNNDGVIQLEQIGSCDRAYARRHKLFFWGDATDEQLMPTARVLAWIHQEHGVPLDDRGLTWSDTNAAYERAPQRMNFAQWRSFTGVCGHQHVPENHHWDPGRFPIDRLLALARRLVGQPTTDPARPWRTSARVAGMPGDEVKRIQTILGVTVDGIYGDRTGGAVRDLQEILDLAPDGVWGPATEETVSKLETKIDQVLALAKQNRMDVDRLPGAVAAAVWNFVVTLRGSKFEGKESTPLTTVAWKAHEHERVRALAEQAARNSAEALERSERIEALLEQIIAAGAEQRPEG